MRTVTRSIFLPVLLCVSFYLPAQTVLLSEPFNSPGMPTGWATFNNSMGGNIDATQWTLRPDGYNYSSNIFAAIFHSNDNSQFYLSNSDEQGEGFTETILRSKSFATSGFPNLTLSFYHNFRQYTSNDTGYVEVSNDNVTWSRAAAFAYPEESQEGGPTAFVLKTVNLSAFSSSPNLYVRFRYYAEYGYYWAIDNVSVIGSATAPCIENSWEGTVSTAWENPLNWSCNAVPTATSIVLINAGKPRYPVVNSIATCKSLTAANGTSVFVSNGQRIDITGP